MKQTETYQFNLPEGSDPRSLAPLNENTARLDALLKAMDAILALTGLSVVEPDAGRRLGELEIGSLVKLGENGVPKPYILLGHDHYGCGETTLLRKDALPPRCFRPTAKPWFTHNGEEVNSSTNAFAGSEYDTFHNVIHVQALDPLVRACLVNVPIPSCRGWIGSTFDKTIDTLFRKCFPLSRSECGFGKTSFALEEGTPFACFTANADRVAYYDGTQKAVYWGNRTPVFNQRDRVNFVSSAGSDLLNTINSARGSPDVTSALHLCPRPALALSPELLVSHEPDGDGCYGVVGLPAFALRAGAAV